MLIKSLILPDASDKPSARKAALLGVWACGIVGAITATFAGFSYFGHNPYNISIWAFLDVAIFGGIGWGIFRMSRTAAIVGALFFIFEKFYMWVEHGLPPNVLSFILMLGFINAVRGTLAYHKHTAVQELPSMREAVAGSENRRSDFLIDTDEYSCSACGGRVSFGDPTCPSCGEQLEYT